MKKIPFEKWVRLSAPQQAAIRHLRREFSKSGMPVPIGVVAMEEGSSNEGVKRAARIAGFRVSEAPFGQHGRMVQVAILPPVPYDENEPLWEH